ncbi:MAG: GyrI-like domain-containing protein [Euryarchaeota archaeon]|nr:GyrI-like domain-containing protein [Euryarchaeota archaeon]
MMPVDISLKRTPAYRVATLKWSGPWNERRTQSQFERVARWTHAQGARTGAWIFLEMGENRWQACVQVAGSVRGDGSVRVRSLPAEQVASVLFDPDQVSPRVVYHGLADWARWRKKEKEIRGTKGVREVYRANPWKDPRAWARTEVQLLLRK